ncbi:MAG: ATP-binding protein [Thermogutta sp.]
MNPCQTEWEEHFAIASTCEEVSHTIEAILMRLRQNGWHEDDCFAVHVALQESLSNAIKHGNRYDPMRRVFISYRLTQEEIEISVRDEGSGFDPSKVPDPTLPGNIDLPSGRGLKLISGFMDQVEFHDAGRQIVMRRSRRHRPNLESTS